MQTQAVAYGDVSEPTARAKRTLMWSRVFLYAGGVLVLVQGIAGLVAAIASIGQSGGSNIGSVAVAVVLLVPITAFGAYYMWAFYWGWITTWRWFRRLMGGTAPGSGLNGIAQLILILVLLWLLSAVASVYGVFGGGIYQYRKAKREVTASAEAADAIAPALRAVDVNPNDGQAWLALATAYWMRRDFDRALHAVNKAIGLNPRDATLWVLKGGILRNASAFSRSVPQLDDALAAFDQALAIAPSSSDAQQARNEALAFRNRGLR